MVEKIYANARERKRAKDKRQRERRSAQKKENAVVESTKRMIDRKLACCSLADDNFSGEW